jgi:hypothetical protein
MDYSPECLQIVGQSYTPKQLSGGTILLQDAVSSLDWRSEANYIGTENAG